MIEVESWQNELRDGFRDLNSLLNYLEISFDSESMISHPDFSLKVPMSFAQRMKKGDPQDPLLLQVLPLTQENQIHPNFTSDSVGDLNSLKKRGLIQKYKGRALILATGACAVHCRYCFRRHFPYAAQTIPPEVRQGILQFLKEDLSIEEVLFSGGDPLLLNNAQWEQWIDELSSISHLRRLRIHTRLLSVLPSRIEPSWVKILSQFQSPLKKIIVVGHFNHPNEINKDVQKSFEKIRNSEMTLLNQSVLLRAINDHAETLKILSERLFEAGALPYYLHLLDRTQGTQHFEVSIQQALSIYKELSSILPGYLVPKLVRETEGQPHKLIVGHTLE